MAESYITRRGSATGGAGSLNIYYGDSPPSDKVGVFCQTTSPVSNIYVEADPMATGENTWVVQNSPVSNQTYYPEGWAYHDGTFFMLYSNKSFYRYDRISQTYSICESIVDSYLNGYWIYEYDNLIIKSGGYSGSTMALYSQAYSVDSNIWTQEYARFPTVYNSAIAKGGYGKNGNSYYVMWYPSYRFRVFAYNLQTETVTSIYNYQHPTEWRYYCNFSALFGDEYYIKGYSAYGTGRAFSAIKINCDTNYVSNWLVGVNLQNIDENWWMNINYGMSVGGQNYITSLGSSVYTMNSDMLTYSSVSSTTNNNPPFTLGKVYNTLGTYAYGLYSNNLMCLYGQDPNEYETNSIIVVSGGTNNKAELISGDSPVEINVMTSYYWDGTTLTELSTQVRTSDTAWIAI